MKRAEMSPRQGLPCRGSRAGGGRIALGLLLWVSACQHGPRQVALEISTVGDTMGFDKPALTVPAGSLVTLTLTNNASSPAMTHNWVLVKQGKLDEVGAQAATLSADQGYVPKNSNILASTAQSMPGQSVQVSFPAPPQGTYEFLCTTPGHYALMKGTFTVH